MLRITLHINTQTIGDYEVRNVGQTRPGQSRYEVRPILDGTTTGEPLGCVLHTRDRGPEALAARVLEQVSRDVRCRDTSGSAGAA